MCTVQNHAPLEEKGANLMINNSQIIVPCVLHASFTRVGNIQQFSKNLPILVMLFISNTTVFDKHLCTSLYVISQ